MSNVVKISLKNLFLQKAFKVPSKLRYNTNGYPFITLISKEGKANNVYFGKKTAELVNGTFEEGTDLVKNGFLIDAEVIETKNEAGEIRYKISKSVGDYTSETTLEEAWGGEIETEFNVENFKKEFSSPVSVTAE